MEIIIYTKADNYNREKLQSEIMETLAIKPAIVFDLNSLFDMLRRHISQEVVIVFLISFEEELDSIISSKIQLFHSRNIIIPPNRDKKIISKCLSLYPRYIADSNYELKDVSAVLNKMFQNHLQYKKDLQAKRVQYEEKSVELQTENERKHGKNKI